MQSSLLEEIAMPRKLLALILVVLSALLLAPVAAQTVPPAFSKLSPPNNAPVPVGTVTTLRWQAVPGAVMKYCISTTANTCPGGEAGYVTAGLGATSAVVTLQPGVRYFWQIRAYVGSTFTPANGVGGWFTFQTMPLVRKIFPPNGSRIVGSSVPLTWSAYPSGTSARLCVSTTNGQCSGGASGYLPVTGTASNLTGIPLNRGLFWQIRIYDPYGGYQPADGTTWWGFVRIQ
jgi:hypothetical protein